MRVGVYIRHAVDAADANVQCKLLPAYRQILTQYPSAEWTRRHVHTIRHQSSPTPDLTLDGPGAWFVEFEVEKK